METVLKTVLVFMASVGSNPTPSATAISDGFLFVPQRAPTRHCYHSASPHGITRENEGGQSMKLCVKKIYCPNCRQAVMGQEPPFNGPYRILCSKCGQSICISNGIYWRWTGEGEATPASETERAPAGKAKKTKASKK